MLVAWKEEEMIMEKQKLHLEIDVSGGRTDLDDWSGVYERRRRDSVTVWQSNMGAGSVFLTIKDMMINPDRSKNVNIANFSTYFIMIG